MNVSGHYNHEFVNGVSFPVSPIDDPALPILESNLLDPSIKVAGYDYRGMFSLADDNLPDPAAGDTVREFLKAIANNWDHARYTPIADSLYEAARYYRGEEVDWGRVQPKNKRAAHPSSYTGSYYTKRLRTPDPSCPLQNCIQEYGQCNGTEIGCHEITHTVRCSTDTDSSCGINCEYKATRTQYYCISYASDPERGNYCSQWGSQEVSDPHYQCDRPLTQCQHRVCSWEGEGNPVYNTPIKQTCQDSFVVLLSDGGPDVRHRNSSRKNAAKNKIKSLMTPGNCKSVAAHFAEDAELASYPTDAALEDGVCGAELTEFMANQDQIDDAILEESQNIATYTVGFGLEEGSSAEGYLKLLAKKGEGGYFSANDQGSLISAFDDILTEIGSSASSYVAPLYVVDEDSLFAHEEEVYLPLFDKSLYPRWSGNLKKFKLSELSGSKAIMGKDGSLSVGGTHPEIAALDEQGQFVDNVSDFWSSTSSDGSSVKAGGVANLLNPANRKLYTDLSLVKDLTHIGNRLDLANVNYQHLGLATDDAAYVQTLVKFIQGYDDDGSIRYHMGDILHNKPSLVSYKSDGSERIIYAGTNEGYLHAFDANSGEERFAFMPKALLKNVEAQYKNNELGKRVYGVDGEFTIWRNDENKDGDIKKADGDFVYLYFGMRRGGRDYYAIDITEPDSPALLWSIVGGAGDFAELGQTWSKPALVKIHSPKVADNGKLIDALIFGGGYDPNLDEEDVAARLPDSMGRAIFMVDASTGELLWKQESILLSHSVPASVRALDVDRNGSVDRLYFGDTGGRLWRVDLDVDIRDGFTDNSLYDLNKADFNLIADFSGSGTDKRKFFNEPDVSLVKENGQVRVLIAIGSGDRPHPLNQQISDRFYVIEDPATYDLPDATSLITDSGLVNYSSLGSQSFISEDKSGWYIDMHHGEKVMATSLTFLGQVMFTTFQSDGVSADPCAIPPSNSRAYVMNILTGENTLDLNRDGNINQSDQDRFAIVSVNEIVDTPQVVFGAPTASDGTACTKDDCQHQVDIRVGKKLTPLADKNNDSDTSRIGNLDLGDILPRSYWLNEDALR